MAILNTVSDDARREELEYMQASNVNVSNFVTVKLSSPYNYQLWMAQMLCLMETHQMCGIIEPIYGWPGDRSHEIIRRYENLLQGWILGSINEEVLKHVIKCRSPQEIWEKLEVLYDANMRDLREPSIEQRIQIREPVEKKLGTKLETKLLKVTLKGHWWKAKAILKNNKHAATMPIGDNTMLHLAVREGHNYFVKELLNFIQDGKQIEKQNSGGQTALHTAAIVDNRYAAELLVKKRKELLGIRDHKSFEPLVTAYFKRQLNTFLYLFEATENEVGRIPSSLILEVELLTNTIAMKQYGLALELVKIDPILTLATKDDNVLMALAMNFPSELGFWEALIYPCSLDIVRQKLVDRSSLLFQSFEFLHKKSEDILWALRCFKNTNYTWLLPEFVLILLVPIAVFYIIYQLIRLIKLVLFFPLDMLYPLLWKFMVFVVVPVKGIEKKMKDYKEAKEFLEVICDQINNEFDNNYKQFSERPVLEAARLDACEVVQQILRASSQTMECKNERGHNVFQLAVINRSEKIYNLLSPMIKRSDYYRTMRDADGNYLMHLAGGLASSFVLSQTTGAALQLQRELQWHEEVRKLMHPTELTFENIYMETSQMTFTREHADLVKEGEQWMKTTAESCSITAALIVTIVFAAAITVPGGSNQETGIPMFKKEIVFTIFSVSDALSLFTAATALLVFLSILTTRFAEKDFLVRLPRRLIFGLCALFVSTTAMMVAFGAILFLVFCDQRTWMLVPIGLFACLPISVIVTLQLPLVVDLFQSTYISRFRKQTLCYPM